MPRSVKDWQSRLAWELRAARRLFVLGVGNPDRADDGAGSLCARKLRRKMAHSHPRDLAETAILDGGEVPESATGSIRNFRPTHVLIVDAASAGHPPGTVFFINKKRINEDDITSHRIPLSLLVRYLEESVGCRVILLGIEPGDLTQGKRMSTAVRRAAEAVAESLSGRRAGADSAR